MERSVVKFAEEIIRMYWESYGSDLDGEAVRSMAVSYGLITFRKPTQGELSDPEWWGHELSIGPDSAGVGVFTREFCRAMKEYKTDEICLGAVEQ